MVFICEFFLSIIVLIGTDEEPIKVYKNLITLIKLYNKSLEKTKEIENYNKLFKSYIKFLNMLYEKVDDATRKISDNIILSEYKKNKNIGRMVIEQNNKYVETKEKENNAKKELFNEISTLINKINNNIEELDNFNSKESNMYLHRIKITENILFHKKDDHYIIDNYYIPYLYLFDLSLIDFSNVDIRGIDFSNTNASIDLQKIYLKDASGCKFSDENIHDFSDYTGVIINGTIFNENPTTMINIDKANYVENSVMNNEVYILKKNNFY